MMTRDEDASPEAERNLTEGIGASGGPRRDSLSPNFCERHFRPLLAALTCLALAQHLFVAAKSPISPDGYRHLWIATQDDWHAFLTQWQGFAHPFLHLALLKGAISLGQGPIFCRLPSVVPGVAAVYMLGLAAGRMYKHKAAALLAAAAYGFWPTMLEIDCDVRSYPLALFLLLTAFHSFAGFMRQPRSAEAPRALALFGLFSALAICSEYYALLFFAACVGAVALEAALCPEFAGDLAAGARAAKKGVAAACILPLCMSAFLWHVHLSGLPHTFPHLDGFYWDRQSPLLPFLIRSLMNEVNLLLPVEVRTNGALAAVLSAAASLVVLVFWRRHSGQRAPSSLAAGMLLLITVALAVCAASGRYPFGGLARQQSLLFPFAILAAFSFADFVIVRSRSLPGRASLLLLAAAAISATSLRGWSNRFYAEYEDSSAAYTRFSSAMPRAQAVCMMDSESRLVYFMHTQTWAWRFRRHIPSPYAQPFSQWDLTDPAGGRSLVLCLDDQEMPQGLELLLTPRFYDALSAAMNAANVSSLNFFRADHWADAAYAQTPAALRAKVEALAATRSLAVSLAIIREDDHTFIGFRRL